MKLDRLVHASKLNVQHNHKIWTWASSRTPTRTLSLLDFCVTMLLQEPWFDFYRKIARKNIFVNFNSHLPSQVKVSFAVDDRIRNNQR